jgi:hypothetical protein
MRQDQYERLQTLSENLADVFLVEADPANWTGKDTPLQQMTQQQRGDRYWEKKNAVATLSLISRVAHLRGLIQLGSQAPDPNNPAAIEEPKNLLDEEITAAEKEASKLMNKLEEQTRKKEFDKRVHG